METYKVNLGKVPAEKWEGLLEQANTILDNAYADIILWESVKKEILEFKKQCQTKTIKQEEEKSIK